MVLHFPDLQGPSFSGPAFSALIVATKIMQYSWLQLLQKKKQLQPAVLLVTTVVTIAQLDIVNLMHFNVLMS